MLTSYPKVPRPEALLVRQLEETGRALTAARAGFNQTADEDLLEYYLYAVSALRAKHTYLLRQLKAGEKPGEEVPS